MAHAAAKVLDGVISARLTAHQDEQDAEYSKVHRGARRNGICGTAQKDGTPVLLSVVEAFGGCFG